MNSRTENTKPPLDPRLRVAITLGSAAFFLSVIVAVFWYQDLRYNRPTPTPIHYQPPVLGSVVPAIAELSRQPDDTRPVLLHFFNQDCPCSRFNIDQARILAEQFGQRVRFVLVLQTSETTEKGRQRALNAARKQFGHIEGVVDPGGQMAERYGVYSTPQAVILNPAGEIAYRGNYNVSRYCTDPATEFARLALESVLAGRPLPNLSPLAYQAYGCELPQASLRQTAP